MSSSRLRDQAPTIFDVFCEIISNSNEGDNRKPTIVWKYPDDYEEVNMLKSIAEFAFPTTFADGEAVQLFTFVLTDDSGRYSFGYCRHASAKRSCFCVLSALPWTDVFYRLLNHVAGLAKRSPGRLTDEAESLLVRAYHQEIPGPGERLTLDGGLGSGNKVEFICPDDKLLPRIPDNRNLTEYYNAVKEENMLSIFANLLLERRIVFTSSKLGKLSACVLAASGLLYPMYWQHIFIPVLPEHLLHYVHAPMPFLIGVPTSTFAKIQKEHIDLSEVIVVHIDSEEYLSPFDDFADLPNEVVHVLKKNLRSSNHLLGDGVARSFLRALVVLLGGYREALRFRHGETITFSEEAFVQSRPPSMRRFLEKMLHLQIFRQFIDERVTTLNTGEDPRDEFEDECSLYSSKEYNRFKTQYNEWMGNMKKGGGAFFKNFKENFKGKGSDAMAEFRKRIDKFKESSASSASLPTISTPGRRSPSPAILHRIGSTIDRSIGGGRSTSRHGNRSKSVLLKEEMNALNKNEDEEMMANNEEQGQQQSAASAGFFVVGGLDLLSEFQYLVTRPNSFIEKIEQQQQKFRGVTSTNEAGTSGGGIEKEEIQQEPLVKLTNGRPPSPAQEAFLIDFGPEKLNPAEMDITDFDPLVTKSASVPNSPKKQTINKGHKESTTITDLRAIAAATSTTGSGIHWETFE